MARNIIIKSIRAKKGERMTGGSGWQLVATKRRKRVFVGTLLKTIHVGGRRIAIFSVPT
jgi:hypothetical protein